MMDKLPMVARILLGLLFFVFGLNGFFNFIPVPPHPGPAGEFLGALVATGYFFPVVKITEIVGGALLLSGCYVPFALILLSPVVVHIALFHIFLEKEFLMTIFIVGLHSYLGFGPYFKHFKGLFVKKA